MTDAATEARALAMLAEAYGCADDFASVNMEVMLQGIGPLLALPALTADRDRIRGEALEEAARIAEGTGQPVGIGDGDTYTVGTATQAAAAIRARALAQPGPVDDGWRDITTAPHAMHVMAARFDYDGGEWIYGVVSSPPPKPWKFWRPLPTPPASTGGEVGK